MVFSCSGPKRDIRVNHVRVAQLRDLFTWLHSHVARSNIGIPCLRGFLNTRTSWYYRLKSHRLRLGSFVYLATKLPTFFAFLLPASPISKIRSERDNVLLCVWIQSTVQQWHVCDGSIKNGTDSRHEHLALAKRFDHQQTPEGHFMLCSRRNFGTWPAHDLFTAHLTLKTTHERCCNIQVKETQTHEKSSTCTSQNRYFAENRAL